MKRKHVIMVIHTDESGDEVDSEILTWHWFYFMACLKLWLVRRLNSDPLEDFVVATKVG